MPWLEQARERKKKRKKTVKQQNTMIKQKIVSFVFYSRHSASNTCTFFFETHKKRNNNNDNNFLNRICINLGLGFFDIFVFFFLSLSLETLGKKKKCVPNVRVTIGFGQTITTGHVFLDSFLSLPSSSRIFLNILFFW